MITPEEEAQLVRLEEREQDFYAGALFLTFMRCEQYSFARRVSAGKPTATNIADLVVEVFQDLNARAERSDV